MSERDSMVCRSCGNEERASEGYPCDSCGTFICQICAMRGITLCKKCSADADGTATGTATGAAGAPGDGAPPPA